MSGKGAVSAAIITALVIVCVLSRGGAPAADSGGSYSWTSVGLGGGGGMFAPAISPHDQNLMFVNCDMGGFYRTTDGGKSWRMVDFRMLQSNTRAKPVFHPVDPNVAYAPEAGDISDLRVTRDRGVTWQPVTKGAPWGTAPVTALGIDRVDGATLLVGAGGRAYLSKDGGATWKDCEGPRGDMVAFHAVKRAAGSSGVLFAASAEGIWRSDDGGATWKEKAAGLPWRDIRSFAAGDDASSGKTVLFVTIPSKAVGGKFAGGVYRSDDLGQSWRSSMGDGLNIRLGRIDEWGSGDIAEYRWLAMSANQTQIVYVTALGTGYYPPYHDTVYVSRDSGKTWRYCLNGDLRFKDRNIELGWYTYDVMWDPGDHAIAVCDANSDLAIHVGGKLYLTDNGGISWRQAYTERAGGQGAPGKGQRWQSIGLEVTTTWDYVIDPHESNRHYICYTDIGFARSTDAGKTWTWSGGGGAWRNTCYMIACDGDRPGVIYGAWSTVHDIPHATHTTPESRRGPGGVCLSRDYGETWEPISKDLPSAPVTSIVLDPTSPPDARVLYVTSIGYGVYRSADSGVHWTRKSNGLGVHGNMETYLVKRYHDGTLYCSITSARHESEFSTADTGLYVSTDGAETWRKMSAPAEVGWPCGFDVDPTDKRVAYMCASNWGPCRSGGLYKTTDAGRTWKRIFDAASSAYEGRGLESFFVRVKDDDSRIVYYSTGTQGLMYSADGGATWKPFRGLPFASIHRVTFDSLNPGMIYVTTFGGGVCHGPSTPQ